MDLAAKQAAIVGALAHEARGDDAMACTVKSETRPAAELEDALDPASVHD